MPRTPRGRGPPATPGRTAAPRWSHRSRRWRRRPPPRRARRPRRPAAGLPTVNATVGVRAEAALGPNTRTPGMAASPSSSRWTSARPRRSSSANTARSRSRRSPPLGARLARKSTAAAAPAMPSWLSVPVSIRSGAGLGRRLQLGDVHRGESVVPAVEHADVGAVELVGGAGQEVAADRADIHQPVGRVVHGVHESESTGVARERCTREPHRSACPARSRPRRWRAGGCGRKAPAPGQPSPAVPSPGRSAPSGPSAPRSRSSARHGAMFAWWSSSVTTISSPGPQVRPEPSREMEGQRRHVGAEGHLARRRAQEIRHRLPRGRQHRVRLATAGIAPVRVGVVVKEILGDGVCHRARDLGAAGPVEVRDGPAGVTPLQRRETPRGSRRRWRHAGQVQARTSSELAGESSRLVGMLLYNAIHSKYL